MLPTFEMIGDWVISSKSYRRGRGIVVGDLVTFRSVREPGEKVIKRVIGLEGDYVLMHTPGSGSDTMTQVCEPWGVGGELLVANRDRCPRVIVGSQGITWMHRWIRGRGVLCRWGLSGER